MTRWVTGALWLLGVLATVGYALMPTAATRSLIQIIVTAGALALTWAFLLRQEQSVRRGLDTIVLAVTVLGVSDLISAIGTHLLRVQSGSEIVSYLALGGYSLLGVGVVRFHRNRVRRRASSGGIEAAIFALGALTPLLVFLIIPVLGHAQLTVARKAITVVCGLVGLFAITVVVRGLLSDVRRSKSLVFFGLAMFSALVATSWSALSTVEGEDALPIQVLLLLPFVLLAAGVAHRSARTAAEGSGRAPEVLPQRWVWFMGVGQAMPLVTLAIVWMRQVPYHAPVIAVAGLSVSALVLVRMAGLLQRIREQSAQLGELARSDELTGLHNRRSWNYELRRACSTAEAHGDPLAIALIDLDHFKRYNDSHGHQGGDALLREAARVWSDMLRPSEVLARYGGEEFALSLSGMSLAEAVARIDELRAATPGDQTFSAGVAAWVPGSDPEIAVAAADEALYRAKHAGRNQVLPALGVVDDRPSTALSGQRVVLQPMFRTDDGTVMGYEVLSRFAHQDDVASVLTHAHEMGYGDQLECAAIVKALAVPGRPEGTALFVNVSDRAMQSERFWAELPGNLSRVVVELQETGRELDEATVTGYLARFRARGARIGLDDLGSRPTDLSRIITLGPDVVKLDRALVRGCDSAAGRAEVLRLFIDFARTHGADVCAMGVETPQELAVVTAAGASLVQGFLLGRPDAFWLLPGAEAADGVIAGA